MGKAEAPRTQAQGALPARPRLREVEPAWVPAHSKKRRQIAGLCAWPDVHFAELEVNNKRSRSFFIRRRR
jgi:hypothetical protein